MYSERSFEREDKSRLFSSTAFPVPPAIAKFVIFAVCSAGSEKGNEDL